MIHVYYINVKKFGYLMRFQLFAWLICFSQIMMRKKEQKFSISTKQKIKKLRKLKISYRNIAIRKIKWLQRDLNHLIRKLNGWGTLSPGWIYSGEFLGENLVHKITPRWFFTFLTILLGKNIESLIVPTEFSNFIFRDFELHSSVSGSASSGSLQSVITFPVNKRVNFLDMIDWLLLVFTDWELDIINSKICKSKHFWWRISLW